MHSHLIFLPNTKFQIEILWKLWSKLRRNLTVDHHLRQSIICFLNSNNQSHQNKSLMMIFTEDKRMNVIQKLLSDKDKSKMPQKSSQHQLDN